MKYVDSHEWIKVEGDIATIGMSSSAIKNLGEIVNIKLPKVNQKVKNKDVVAILETSKSAIEITSPISGKIVEVNISLEKDLKNLNEYPESLGWLFKIKIKD
ncbi:MAG: hypothetical protein AMS24_03075 [Chlamydiae bacterium SM23_39]|nr:MAG: hypothetical protein AMS24_03075 [Chlamydiae bacterium SM23_39]